jgi:atrial natriuretic peptide receptor A
MCGLAWWYETRHFLKTIWKHPHILVTSLVAFGVVCGVGMVAITSEKNAYIQKQMSTAEFIARETGDWFANEFRKAMVPLYSVQQGVIHSNYFDEVAEEIGRYPNRLIPETVGTPKVLRNVTGLCDDPDLQLKFREIVQPINEENDLDGIIFAYRLAPRNVFCLFERPDMSSMDPNFGMDAGSSSQNPFWKTVTTEMFIERKYSIFGPFGLPDKEWFCGHIPIWSKPDPSSAFQSSLNVHGTEVPFAWGFTMNFLDWRKLKERSNIYERFAGSNLDFKLTRASKYSKASNPKMEDTTMLAMSPDADLLDDTNSVVIQTESLHGIWENRVGSIYGYSPPWYPGAVAGVVLGAFIIAFLTASTLVEKQLHRNLVGKMLPRKAIVKLHRGQTVLEKYNLVTIFFSDIVGFTSLAGQMRPIQVMKMLNELYTEFDKLVEKHHLYKVETIGDAYMVVGGAPDNISAPLAAERVAAFALDAVNFVRDFKTQDGDQIFIRAGIASGPVVAGVVGQSMPRYCFFGDTVNFASRMESTSKKMKIQIAEVTYRLLQDAPTLNFALEKRVDGDVAGVHVKGKGHQITYWAQGFERRCETTRKVVEVPTMPHDLHFDVEAAPRNLPLIEEDKVANIDDDAGKYSADEIYSALTSQAWEKLGHAESICGATDDTATIVARASAILKHHLLQVMRKRNNDENATMSLAAQLQIRHFVSEVAATYRSVKFHNLSHAMHVMTSMNKLLPETLDEDPLNGFSLVFSALVHDAGHTGMSNKILKETHHPLSTKYNDDVPIAERESINIALEILFRPEFETLRSAILPEVLDKIQFTKILFQGILVTDIATPERVKLGVERFQVAQNEQGQYETRLCPLAPYLDDIFDGVGLDEEVKTEFPDEFIITHDGLQKCVKNEHLMLLSDISHLLQGWENFAKWNFRLYKELMVCFKNGQCDDPRSGWYQGQVGFYEHYILPLAKRSKVFFNETFADALVQNGLRNLKLWIAHGKKATSIMINAEEEGLDESETLIELYQLANDN